MVGWHHQLDGHEFEQAPGAADGQRSLVCCSFGVTKTELTDFMVSSIVFFVFHHLDILLFASFSLFWV